MNDSPTSQRQTTVDPSTSPLRIVSANDFYIDYFSRQMRRVSALSDGETSLQHFSSSPFLFSPSDFRNPERIVAKLAAAESDIPEFARFLAGRINNPVNEVEAELREILAKTRRQMDHLIDTGNQWLRRETTSFVSDEERSAFENTLRNNSGLIPDYLLSAFSRHRVNFLIAHNLPDVFSRPMGANDSRYDNTYYVNPTVNLAAANINIAALEDYPGALSDYVMEITRILSAKLPPPIDLDKEGRTLKRALILEMRGPGRSFIKHERYHKSGRPQQPYNPADTMHMMHYWLNDPRSGLDPHEVRKKMPESVALYEAHMNRIAQAELQALAEQTVINNSTSQMPDPTPMRSREGDAVNNLDTKELEDKSAANYGRILVLAPDDFIIDIHGKCLPIAAYLQRDNLTLPSFTLATFNLRDITEPSELAKKLAVNEQLLEFLIESHQRPPLQYQDIGPDDIRRVARELSAPGKAEALAEEALRLARQYSVESSPPDMEQRRQHLLLSLLTPTFMQPPEIISALQQSRSVFLFSNTKKDPTKTQYNMAANNRIVLLSQQQAEEALLSDYGMAELWLGELVFQRLCQIKNPTFTSPTFFHDVTAEYDRAHGHQIELNIDPKDYKDAAHRLANTHYLASSSERVDTTTLSNLPLNLYQYHGLMVAVKMDAAVGRVTEEDFEGGFPKRVPISSSLRPGERSFWGMINQALERLDSDTETLYDKFAAAYGEQIIMMTDAAARLIQQNGCYKPQDPAYASERAEGAIALITQQTKEFLEPGAPRVTTKTLPVQIGAERNYKDAQQKETLETLRKATRHISADVKDYPLVGVDLAAHVYSPLLGLPKVFSPSENVLFFAESALGEYAAGIRSMPDLIDICPETTAHSTRPVIFPSPQRLFLACLQEALLSIARDKGISEQDGALAMTLHAMEMGYQEAVRPQEIAGHSYDDAIEHYERMRKSLAKAGKPESAHTKEAIESILEDTSFTNLNSFSAMPLNTGSPVELIPRLLQGRIAYMQRACNVIEQVVPLIKKDREEAVYIKRAGAAVSRILAVKNLGHDEWQVLFRQTREIADTPTLDMEVVAERGKEAVIEPFHRALDAMDISSLRIGYLTYLETLARKAEQASKQKPRPAPPLPNARTTANNVFEGSCVVANRLHQRTTGAAAATGGVKLSTSVLTSLWQEVTAFHESAKVNTELQSVANAIFSDSPMMILEYMATPLAAKFEPQALNKRFSITRATQLPKIQKTIGDILELAAVEKQEPGEKIYTPLAEAILASPTLLVCATGDRQLADQVRSTMQAQAGKFSSAELNAGLVKESLSKMGIDQQVIDAYYPPPRQPTPGYTTTQGVPFYTRSPRHVDMARELDRLKADADMFLMGALGENHTNCQCNLARDLRSFELIFADDEGNERKYPAIPLQVTHIDDIIDLHIALQSYLLNKPGIEPLRRRNASGKIGVALNEVVPADAGNPEKSTTRIYAGSGQLYIVVNTTERRGPIKLSLPLGIADTPENRPEADARKEYVEYLLHEKWEHRQHITKGEVVRALEKHVKEERKQPMLSLEKRLYIEQGDDQENPPPLPLSFPKNQAVQRTFLSPPSVQLEPGGRNPSYILHFNIHVNQGSSRGIGDSVRGLAMRLHTTNPALAIARARMAIRQVESKFAEFADAHPEAQWAFLPQPLRRAYRSPLVTRSDTPAMSFNALEEIIDSMTQYEQDVWVEQAHENPDDPTQFKLRVIRGRRRDAFDHPDNALIIEPHNTIEPVFTGTKEGGVVPMAMSFHAPNAIPGQIPAFVEAVQHSFHSAIADHYTNNAIAVRPGTIPTPPEERDVYIPARDYRESTAREKFEIAVAHNLHELGEGARIVEPLPEAANTRLRNTRRGITSGTHGQPRNSHTNITPSL